MSTATYPLFTFEEIEQDFERAEIHHLVSAHDARCLVASYGLIVPQFMRDWPTSHVIHRLSLAELIVELDEEEHKS